MILVIAMIERPPYTWLSPPARDLLETLARSGVPAAAIDNGEIAAMTPSLVELIRRASTHDEHPETDSPQTLAQLERCLQALGLARDSGTVRVEELSSVPGLSVLTVLGATAQLEQERDSLLEQERERRIMARTLAEVTISLTSRRHVDGVLDEILRGAGTIMPYQSGNISLIRDGLVEPVRWTGYSEIGGEELMRSTPPSLEELPIAQQVIRTRKPYVVPNTEHEPGWRSFSGTEWIKSFLIIPIIYRDEVRGFLRLDSPESGHFSAEAGERLLPLANAAAVALENARLVEGLEEEIAERRNVEQQLRRSLDDKEVLVREIHHRVKNNLAMVSSIMRLQRNELPEIPEVERHFEELQSRIRAIAGVHEQLYQTGNISRISLAQYVPEIISGIQTTLRHGEQGISIEHEIEDLVVTVNEATPIGLIITEALTNTLKHAFAPGSSGRVSVRIRSYESTEPSTEPSHKLEPTAASGSVELAVIDNGGGITADGPPPEKSGSLGMLLMRNLSEQLGGSLRIESNSEGTRVLVTLPPECIVR